MGDGREGAGIWGMRATADGRQVRTGSTRASGIRTECQEPTIQTMKEHDRINMEKKKSQPMTQKEKGRSESQIEDTGCEDIEKIRSRG